MRTLILYGTLGCHLCEQAFSLVSPRLMGVDFRLVEVDISDSEQLMTDYGIRIPVLCCQESGAELGWPFGDEQLLQFLESLD